MEVTGREPWWQWEGLACCQLCRQRTPQQRAGDGVLGAEGEGGEGAVRFVTHRRAQVLAPAQHPHAQLGLPVDSQVGQGGREASRAGPCSAGACCWRPPTAAPHSSPKVVCENGGQGLAGVGHVPIVDLQAP